MSVENADYLGEVDCFQDTTQNVVGYIDKLTAKGLISKDSLPGLIAAIVNDKQKGKKGRTL